MSGLVRYEATGSALLDELIVRRKQIRARMRPPPRAQVKDAALTCAQVKDAALPCLPPWSVKTVEMRVSEARALLEILPTYRVKSIIEDIWSSAEDCGEVTQNGPPEQRPIIATPGRPTVLEIQNLVAWRFGIGRAYILSAWRTASVVRPRQIAMYLSRLLAPHSFRKLARMFGRDHTAVVYAVRKITQLVGEDKTLAEEIECLKRMLLE